MTPRNAMQIGPFTYVEHEGDYVPRNNYLSFYAKIFKQLEPRKYPFYRTLCPFHSDKNTPNLHINVVSGTYNCFACGAKGSAYDFMVTKNGDSSYTFDNPEVFTCSESQEKAAEYERITKKRKDGSSELILAVETVRAETAHEFLFQQPNALRHLQRDRGFTIKSIKEWKLGFMKGTITIPVFGRDEKLVTLRFHKKYQTEGFINQIYPWKAVMYNKCPYVILTEGELDMMLVRQYLFNAATQLDGANGWETYFTQYFKNKTVYIAYDNDDAGIDGALKVARTYLWPARIPTNIVQWPSFMQEKEDHINFFIKYKQTVNDYRQLLRNAKSILTY